MGRGRVEVGVEVVLGVDVGVGVRIEVRVEVAIADMSRRVQPEWRNQKLSTILLGCFLRDKAYTELSRLKGRVWDGVG